MKRALFLFALLASPALAQGNPATSSPLSGIFDQIAGQAEGQKPVPAAPVSEKLLIYKPSSVVSAEVRALFLNGLIAQGKKNGTLTPALEQQVRSGFAKVDIAATYQTILKPKGYNAYNVATALTVYVVSALNALDGTESTDAQDRATYEQFRKAFGGVKAIQTMSDAEKQKFSEALLWLTAFQANDLEQARKGTKGYTLEGVRGTIRQSLLDFNFDPEQIMLGKNGLQARP